MTSEAIDGEVLRIDHFGNLITNIDRKTFHTLSGDRPVAVHIASQAITNVVSTYADVAPGELCALFGSSDHLEIAARGTSAAVRLGTSVGAAVHVGRPA